MGSVTDTRPATAINERNETDPEWLTATEAAAYSGDIGVSTIRDASRTVVGSEHSTAPGWKLTYWLSSLAMQPIRASSIYASNCPVRHAIPTTTRVRSF